MTLLYFYSNLTECLPCVGIRVLQCSMNNIQKTSICSLKWFICVQKLQIKQAGNIIIPSCIMYYGRNWISTGMKTFSSIISLGCWMTSQGNALSIGKRRLKVLQCGSGEATKEVSYNNNLPHQNSIREIMCMVELFSIINATVKYS